MCILHINHASSCRSYFVIYLEEYIFLFCFVVAEKQIAFLHSEVERTIIRSEMMSLNASSFLQLAAFYATPLMLLAC